MATTPGLLTEWPWKNVGNFKYLILAPWAFQSLHAAATKKKHERDYANLLIIPFLLWRAFHSQIWMSVSRHRNAKGRNRIVHRTIEFEQVDRESNWDDHILFSGIVYYLFNNITPMASFLPTWRTKGIIITFFLHIGPVEYLYYWLHRALHQHYLYSRYHSHHHSSIVSEPVTAVIHPFVEVLAYYLLFSIPLLGTFITRTASLMSLFGYVAFIDIMNCMGHCNFELIPSWVFSIFPPLKYMMYTPSFHSLHHTRFKTNYSLFMPFYDYIHGTMDKTTNDIYEASLERKEEFADVVHLTHLTTLESIFHIQVGFPSFSSRPMSSKLCYSWPLTCWSMMLNLIGGRTFVAETNYFENLKLQSWVIPQYSIQPTGYVPFSNDEFSGSTLTLPISSPIRVGLFPFIYVYSLKSRRKSIDGLIEEAIMQAGARGAKVISLGLLNQGAELNTGGRFNIGKYPMLNVKVIDGSSLTVAIVLNSIPKGTSEILFIGSLTKTSYAIVSALFMKGIKVVTFYDDMKDQLSSLPNSKVILSKSATQKVWIVGDSLTSTEQLKATKGTLFIPFSHFPPKRVRQEDCFYYQTPSMIAPPSLRNLHSCENWLPRRVMSACRVAGIIHALEGWNMHECDNMVFSDIDLVWDAALKHGFHLSTNSE